MEKTGRVIRYLCEEDFIECNREIITKTGGFIDGAGKVINSNSLHYLVNIIKGKIDNTDIYQTLIQKAAVYCFNIITRHIFLDGNKRTGMICAFFFLQINGINLKESISDNEIVEVALKVANSEMDLDELTEWFEEIVIINEN